MEYTQQRPTVATTRLSAKGWVVIPSQIRKRYGLQPGDRVHVRDDDGQITLIPALKDPIRDLRGIFKGRPSMAADLVAEHRREVERDEREHKKWLARQVKSLNGD